MITHRCKHDFSGTNGKYYTAGTGYSEDELIGLTVSERHVYFELLSGDESNTIPERTASLTTFAEDTYPPQNTEETRYEAPEPDNTDNSPSVDFGGGDTGGGGATDEW